jgi:hypothetical protein
MGRSLQLKIVVASEPTAAICIGRGSTVMHNISQLGLAGFAECAFLMCSSLVERKREREGRKRERERERERERGERERERGETERERAKERER